MIVPVILSGGSGTRLWPLSRPGRPKQFLPLISDHSLLQETVLRLDSLEVARRDPVIVCNEAHGPLIREQLEAVGRTAGELLFEPAGRNTAPAVAVAALLTELRFPGENPSLLVLPADHAIGRPEAFAAAVSVALRSADEGSLVTFGIPPDRAETGYGYIKRGERAGELYVVDAFVEKPDHERAQAYLESGDYYWNSGMFMFKSATYLAELESFAPEIITACRQAMEGASEGAHGVGLGREAFLACPSDSIDYAVMEGTAKGVVMPLDADWSDVGSWSSLHDVCEHDARGNTLAGDVLAIDCRESYLRAGDRLLAAVGLDGLVVIDTPDALFVAPRERAQDVREVVARLEAAERPEADGAPADRLSEEDRSPDLARPADMTRLELSSGDARDVQQPSESRGHLIVVEGEARVTLGSEVVQIRQGESAEVPSGASSFRVENPAEELLTILVVTVRLARVPERC